MLARNPVFSKKEATSGPSLASFLLSRHRHRHQKDILNLAISSCSKPALLDRGSLRLKLALSRVFKAASHPPPPTPQTWHGLAAEYVDEGNSFTGQSAWNI